jgi:hypothetical protein
MTPNNSISHRWRARLPAHWARFLRWTALYLFVLLRLGWGRAIASECVESHEKFRDAALGNGVTLQISYYHPLKCLGQVGFTSPVSSVLCTNIILGLVYV